MPFESKVIDAAFVVIWDKPVLVDIAAVVNATEQLSRRLAKRVTYVAYIPDAMAAPDQKVRTAMTQSLDTLREHCDHVVLILEGSGFRLSIGRSVLAGILLVSGRRGQVHIFASLDEAAALTPPAVMSFLRTRQVKETGS